MARLDELKLDPNVGPALDMAELPEEVGEFSSPPYPGKYTFQLPHEIDFEEFKAKIKGNEVERIRANIDSAHPLLIVAASPETADEVGKMVTMYRFSNAEYTYTRKGEEVTASEMAHLLKGGFEVVLKKGASNLEWAQALDACAGKNFGAEVEWQAYCNPDKKRWVQLKDGTRKEDDADGCGRRYAQKGYKKGDGTTVHEIPQGPDEDGSGSFFYESFPCQCGAEIRVSPRLRRYGPVIFQPVTPSA